MATISQVYQGTAQPNVFFKDAVLASGASSVDVTIDGYKLAGLAFPSGMASTAYTFSVSVDEVFYPVFDNTGLELSAAVATGASRFVYFSPSDSALLEGDVRIKGATGETAQRTIKLILRPY
jgi:hypothetical protein